jgi:predicted RNA-binding Zn-ribbon protein involved in translation (DUF1610 family)
MAAKLTIPLKRMFGDVFVCKQCNKKIRTQAVRILAGKVTCPRCGNRTFRPKRKK